MNRFLSKTWANLSSMSTGKKIYASLWALTGILLIVLVVLFVAWQTTLNEPTQQSNKEITIVATFGFLFLTSLITTIFTTVIVSIREKKGGKK